MFLALTDPITESMQLKQARAFDDSSLDEGIAPYVKALRAAGVETFESCQGGEGHAYAEPTIRITGERHDGFRFLASALQAGLPVAKLRRVWRIIDGEPEGPYWELTFNYLP